MSAEELLAALPPEERVVLLLCAAPGRTYRAVAEALGLDPAVVLARLRSALRRVSPQEVAGDVLPQPY